jgi:putative oxidoreductase
MEFFGGLLLLAGLFTRVTAFLLSGEMAAAYLIAHASRSFFPALNMGEAAVIYCFLFLYLAAAGGGAWSLDRVFRAPRAGGHLYPADQPSRQLGGAIPG